MRILIAAVIGGLLMWAWGAVSHMMLPIGEMGMRVAPEQRTALSAVQAHAGEGAGIYMLPSMEPEKWSDRAAVEAFVQEHRGSPYAFVVYAPDGNPAMASMTPNLLKQLASDTLAALLAAWIMALAAFGFGKRVMIAAALGLFSWLTISVPYWNWYLFPADFTLGALLGQVIGWTIAGAGMAWWLGRKGH